MPTDRSSTAYRAFVIPDPRVSAETFEPSLSTYTQAGPLPGVPEQQQDSALVLHASGAQTSGSALRVRTLEGGFPGAGGGTFAWKEDGDALWRGWDAPDAISDFEFVEWSTTADAWRVYDTCTDHNGVVYIATVADNQRVVVLKRGSATLWADYEVYDHGQVYGDDAAVALCVLPQRSPDDPGRLLCFYMVYESGFPYVQMAFSDDSGVTWTVGSARCSPSSWTAKAWRLRARYYQGSVVILVHMEWNPPKDVVQQWVSLDNGCSFRKVDESTTDNHGMPDMTVLNGRLYVGFIKSTGGTPDYRGYVASIGSPGEPVFSAAATLIESDGGTPYEWATESASAITAGELVLVSDDDGALWLYGVNHDSGTTYTMSVFVSVDGGATWTEHENTLTLGDTTTRLRWLSGVKQSGRVGLASTHAANPGTGDDSVSMVWLGGYCTVPRPVQTWFPGWGYQETWTEDWIALDLPEDTGTAFSGGGSGSPTVTRTSGGVRVQHSDALMNRQWTGTLTDTLTKGAPLEVGLKVVAGTGYAEVQVSDGAGESYCASVEVTPTAITLKDEHGATTIATVTTTAGASGVTVRLDVGKSGTGKVRAWYRPLDSSPDREFIAIGSSSALTDGASATRRVRFGTRTGSATADVYFRRASTRLDGWATTTNAYWFLGQSNPDGIQGRAYTSVPTIVSGGLRLRASEGPTVPGEEWHVDTRYEHGVENLDWRVDASPSRGWRSTTTGSDVELVWRFTTGTNGSRMLGPTVAFCFLNCNWNAGEVYGLNAVGSWVSIATIDASDGQDGLTFDRENDTLVVDSATAAAERYHVYGQLRGSYVFTDDGGGGLAQYKIVEQSEGVWSGATVKRPRLYVEGVDTASDPATGTLRIVARDHLVIVHDLPKYRAIKLKITGSQPTYENDFRIGKFVPGHVHYLAVPYSFGRIKAVEPNTDLYTNRAGRRRAKVRGEPRRAVTFDFGDWVPSRAVQIDNPSPDYALAATGGEPVASLGDAIHSLVGVVRACRGPEVPVVYVERVPKSANTSTVIRIVNGERFIYGRFVSAARVEHRRGEEGQTETNTAAPMTIEEEL